jgi:hypothetical protein
VITPLYKPHVGHPLQYQFLPMTITIDRTLN